MSSSTTGRHQAAILAECHEEIEMKSKYFPVCWKYCVLMMQIEVESSMKSSLRSFIGGATKHAAKNIIPGLSVLVY